MGHPTHPTPPRQGLNGHRGVEMSVQLAALRRQVAPPAFSDWIGQGPIGQGPIGQGQIGKAPPGFVHPPGFVRPPDKSSVEE